MTISIGGRPISKVVAGYISAVVIDGIAVVIDTASSDFNLSGGGWLALLVGSFGPPTAAYLRKLSGKDVQQIIEAAPEKIRAEADMVLKHKSPY